MKTLLFSLLLVNALDCIVMPYLTARCRSGAMWDKSTNWLPFSALYKLFLIVELFVIGNVGYFSQAQFACVIFLTVPFLIDIMSLVMAIKSGFSYTINDPWNGTVADFWKIKNWRFHPVYKFNTQFFFWGIVDNGFRYLSDIVIVVAIIKILHFL